MIFIAYIIYTLCGFACVCLSQRLVYTANKPYDLWLIIVPHCLCSAIYGGGSVPLGDVMGTKQLPVRTF